MKLSQVRYQVFKRVMPYLKHEQHFHMNLAERGWPVVSSYTASREYDGTIDSIDCADKGEQEISDLIRQNAKTSTPIVLRDYIKPQSDVPRTFDRLKEVIGQDLGKARVGNYDQAAGAPDFVDCLVGEKEFPFKDKLAPGKGPYMGNASFSTLARMMPLPDIFPSLPNTTFWLGGGESRTPLHCHVYCDVLLTQLIGRRRVMLVPPHQSSLVGCIPRNINICTATYDPFEPDESVLPGGDPVVKLHHELEPGSALLIPGFWFHAVRLAAPSMAGSQFNDTAMPLSLGGGSRQNWRDRDYAQGWG